MPQLTRFASLTAALVAAASALAVGCSVLVDVGGLAGPADAAAAPSSESGALPDGSSSGLDSGGKDATATTDGPVIEGDGGGPPDANEHVGPNLLADSSFESGCTWNSFQGTIATESGTARTGTKSCRVCAAASTPDYYTGGDPFTGGAPIVGATYRATAWVRTAPGAVTPPGAIFFVRASNAVPFTTIDSANTPQPRLRFTATWQKLELSLTSTAPAGSMDIFVGTDTAVGSCFLLDDVWLEKLP